MQDDHDDELLLALRHALEEVDPIPESVLAVARGAFDWAGAIDSSNLDLEYAMLTFDSRLDLAGVRGVACQLTMSAPSVDVEIAIEDDGDRTPDATKRVTGQLVPASTGDVELHTVEGMVARVRADDLGRFGFSGLTPGRYRLLVIHADAPSIATMWFDV